MKIATAVAEAASRFATVSDTARLDAELLMAFALGIGRERLLLDRPDGSSPVAFEQLVQRRLGGEPVAYIVGRRAFWTIELEVGRGVLIPRPDSETLLEAAIAHFAGGCGPRRILDLGTGPGTLLLAALDQWPDATGLGVDRSSVALDYARRNAAQLGIAGRAEFHLGNWAEEIHERFDLVLANPPYVAEGAMVGRDVGREPVGALFGGPDGLDAYRALAPQLPRLIAPGGFAAVEIGFDQAESASELFRVQSLEPAIAFDLGDRPRALHFAP